jgi:hypothetical protein
MTNHSSQRGPERLRFYTMRNVILLALIGVAQHQDPKFLQ